MKYIGTVSIEGKISVDASTPEEANKLILSRLAEISTEFIALKVGMRNTQVENGLGARGYSPHRSPLTDMRDLPQTCAMDTDSPAPDLSFTRRETETPADPDGGGKGLKQVYGSFGKFLHQFMFDNGLSDKGASNLLNVTPTTIANWKAGKTKPRGCSAMDIANKLQELSANEYRSADIQSLMR